MANWDFITAFNSEAVAWLDREHLPHPLPTYSRLPSTKQIETAWRTFDTADAILIDGFDWDDPTHTPGDGFKMRGDRKIQLQVLRLLCEHCGQLWMYPDTGEPAIIVSESIDPDSVAQFHEECNQHEDAWERFYCGQYAT